MEDLKQLVLDLLEIEKKNLAAEKNDYRAAIVVVITPTGRYFEEMQFETAEEMDAAYASVVERARLRNASAIITINTAREQESDGDLDGYWWGKLQAENQPRTILATISGPGLQSLSMSVPFRIENDQVVFGTRVGFETSVLALLPNWP